MSRLTILTKAAALIWLSTSAFNAAAQSSDFAQDGFQSDTQARVTIKIPIGPKTTKTKDAPRLEFGIRSYQETPQDRSWVYRDAPFQEASFGLTLNKEPQFLLNGQVFEFKDERENLGTAGKIGVGALIVVVVGVGALVIALEDYENNDPD